jgi:predicted dehydrogenase
MFTIQFHTAMAHQKPLSPLRVGVVGCGNISNAYFEHSQPFSDYIKIVACADLDVVRAKAKAAERGLSKGGSVREILEDPEIDIILNLTIPAAHAEVNQQALKAGKHAYCEKPFGLNFKEGLKTMSEAKKRNLRVGCAPDTVLGSGIQTCRRLIEEGAIGKPVAATANMLCRGHETWHPNPEFYYLPGGGPLFDMGPYYLTALVTMLGEVKSVSAAAKITFKERLITSQPLHGKKIKVKTPTHLSGILEFAQGSIATVNMSFDTWANHMPLLEVYGTEGSIQCPDPNNFDGEVFLWTAKKPEWQRVAPQHPTGLGRGIGLADMADAIQRRRRHRASGELGLHVLEVMESFHKSADAGRKVVMKSKCRQPDALPTGLAPGKL